MFVGIVVVVGVGSIVVLLFLLVVFVVEDRSLDQVLVLLVRLLGLDCDLVPRDENTLPYIPSPQSPLEDEEENQENQKKKKREEEEEGKEKEEHKDDLEEDQELSTPLETSHHLQPHLVKASQNNHKKEKKKVKNEEKKE